jgi:hypothetical protein
MRFNEDSPGIGHHGLMVPRPLIVAPDQIQALSLVFLRMLGITIKPILFISRRQELERLEKRLG